MLTQLLGDGGSSASAVDAGPGATEPSKTSRDAGPKTLDAGNKAPVKAKQKVKTPASKTKAKPTPKKKSAKSKPAKKKKSAATPTKKKSPAPSKASGQAVFDDAIADGRILAKQGKFKAAIAEFQKGLKISGRNAIANFEVGKAYNEIGNYKQATNYLQKAVRYGIRNSEVHVYLGTAYQAQGNNSKAKKEWQTYLKKSPNGKYAKRIKKMLTRL